MNNDKKFRNLVDLRMSVFPVFKGSKQPAERWTKYQHNFPALTDVMRWEADNMNVGVVCGRLSNLLVIDVDSEEAQATYNAFNAPVTPTVRTSKGSHYYFRHPAQEIRNSTKVKGVALDVRGEGGYVVGPGSIHESGITYEWEVTPEETPFADLPKNIIEAVSPASGSMPSASKAVALRPQPVTIHAGDNRYADWIADKLQRGLAHIAAAQEGERNDTLNFVSYGIGTYVAAAQLDWVPYAQALADAGVSNGLTVEEANRTISSAWTAAQENPCRWLDTAQRYVLLTCQDQFWDVQEQIGVKASAINKTHNSERDWQRVPMANYLTDNDLVDKAFDLKFDPEQPTGVYVQNGRRWLNTYVDPGISSLDGDATPFAEFMEHLIPNGDERAHLLRMIAWTVRHPGQKLSHALLLRTERQGTGKSMLIEIWRELLCNKNTRLTSSEEIMGNYQSFIEGNIFIVVEELNIAFGKHAYNRVKNLISGHTAEVNEKFVTSRERPNHASFVFLTNLSEPILIEDSDRRFFYVDSPAAPKAPEYYAEFAAWWKANLGIILGFLEGIDLSDFNPFAPPPQTEAKLALQYASKSQLEQELIEARDERRWPFSRDIVRLEEVRASIPAAHSAPPQRLNSAMRAIGAELLGQHRVPGEWCGAGGRPTFIAGAGTKPSLWAVANVQFWTMADPQSRVEEFMRTKGSWEFLDDHCIALRHARSDPDMWRDLSNQLGV